MKTVIAFSFAAILLMMHTVCLADALTYTDQHVIVKDATNARRNRPEKIEAPVIKLGNFTLQVPALAESTAVAIASSASSTAFQRAGAASVVAPAKSNTDRTRSALFVLATNRELSTVDEARLKELLVDGASEVWAPKDAHQYVSTLIPHRDDNSTAVRAWVDCTSDCENWVWIERRGVMQ